MKRSPLYAGAVGLTLLTAAATTADVVTTSDGSRIVGTVEQIADGKLIILDDEGYLTLAVASPKALDVRSKVQVLKKKAWAAPALVGTRLYIRDNETIMALDLG